MCVILLIFSKVKTLEFKTVKFRKEHKLLHKALRYTKTFQDSYKILIYAKVGGSVWTL